MSEYKKIAVISDIHGNLEALTTVLEDIKKRKADMIICLGDIIAKGGHPSECVKLIRENCDVVIRGNCDRHFTSDIDLTKLPEYEVKRLQWNKSLLTKEDMDYLQKLPTMYEFYLSGSLVRMFHATPDKDNVAVDVMDDFPVKYKMFEKTDENGHVSTADIVVFGHIHHCFLQRFYNRTLINAGSVGNSHEIIRNDKRDANVMETTQAVYLILEGEFGAKEYGGSMSWQFVRVPYDIEKELKSNTNNLEYNEFAYELTQGRYRNMEKVYRNLRKSGVKTENI